MTPQTSRGTIFSPGFVDRESKMSNILAIESPIIDRAIIQDDRPNDSLLVTSELRKETHSKESYKPEMVLNADISEKNML